MSFHSTNEKERVRYWLGSLAVAADGLSRMVAGVDFPTAETIRTAIGIEQVEGVAIPVGDATVAAVADLDEVARRVTKHFEEIGIEPLPF
jgi:hypothetical protein